MLKGTSGKEMICAGPNCRIVSLSALNIVKEISRVYGVNYVAAVFNPVQKEAEVIRRAEADIRSFWSFPKVLRERLGIRPGTILNSLKSEALGSGRSNTLNN